MKFALRSIPQDDVVVLCLRKRGVEETISGTRLETDMRVAPRQSMDVRSIADLGWGCRP